MKWKCRKIFFWSFSFLILLLKVVYSAFSVNGWERRIEYIVTNFQHIINISKIYYIYYYNGYILLFGKFYLEVGQFIVRISLMCFLSVSTFFTSTMKWFISMNSGSQPGWLELVPGVPPIVKIHRSVYLLYQLGCRQIVSLIIKGAMSQKRLWNTDLEYEL